MKQLSKIVFIAITISVLVIPITTLLVISYFKVEELSFYTLNTKKIAVDYEQVQTKDLSEEFEVQLFSVANQVFSYDCQFCHVNNNYAFVVDEGDVVYRNQVLAIFGDKKLISKHDGKVKRIIHGQNSSSVLIEITDNQEFVAYVSEVDLEKITRETTLILEEQKCTYEQKSSLYDSEYKGYRVLFVCGKALQKSPNLAKYVVKTGTIKHNVLVISKNALIYDENNNEYLIQLVDENGNYLELISVKPLLYSNNEVAIDGEISTNDYVALFSQESNERE